MDERGTEWFWNKIMLLSYICSVMVVYLHSDNTEQYSIDTSTATGAFVWFLETDILQLLAKGAVPLFFFISGFLFFRNFGYSSIVSKYKSRFRGLLIPYISWNMIYTLVVILCSCIPVIRNHIGDRWVMNPITPLAIFKGVFFYQYNLIFWFMFQLILFVIVSPLLYTMLRQKYLGAVLQLLLLLCASKIVEIPVINFGMLLIYSLGGYLSIHAREAIVRKSTKFRSITAIVVFAVLRVGLYAAQYFSVAAVIKETLTELLMISYVFALFFGIDLIKMKQVKEYMRSTFFIYALHLLVLSVYKRVFRFILPDTEWMALITFLTVPIMTIMTICLISHLMKKICRPVYCVLAGGRA